MNSVAILCLVLLAVVLTTEAQIRTTARTTTTTRMPGHPNNELIRIGLMDKLCKQKYGSTSSSTTKSPGTTGGRRTRAATTPRTTSTTTPAAGPTCSDFNTWTFEQLINGVKANLKPVGQRQ